MSVKSSKVHQSADDTNLSLTNISLQKISKWINHNLALLVNRLQSTNISLNAKKENESLNTLLSA